MKRFLLEILQSKVTPTFYIFSIFVDELGNVCFYVQGDWPNKFHMMDKFKRELVHIKKRSLIAFEPTYDFYQPGTKNLWMSITKEFSFMTRFFRIELPLEKDQIHLEGVWGDYRFVRKSSGAFVGTAQKEYFTFTDTYVVQIAPTENIPLIMACAIILEHENRRNRQT